MRWIDTHAHLNDERFEGRVDPVLRDAASVGVDRVLVVGIDVASSRRAVELSSLHEAVFAVVGIQPNSLHRLGSEDWNEVLRLLDDAKSVAVGETGLDRYWDFAPIELQREWFDRHLELADQLGLPVVIHCRDAEADVLESLSRFADRTGRPIAGVMHSYAGDRAFAESFVKLGLHISFSGMLTFKKNEALREVAAAVPMERLMVETDTPYLSPHPLRGKENQPANVVHTGLCLAETRGVSGERIAEITTRNAEKLFRLPDSAGSA